MRSLAHQNKQLVVLNIQWVAIKELQKQMAAQQDDIIKRAPLKPQSVQNKTNAKAACFSISVSI